MNNLLLEKMRPKGETVYNVKLQELPGARKSGGRVRCFFSRMQDQPN